MLIKFIENFKYICMYTLLGGWVCFWVACLIYLLFK